MAATATIISPPANKGLLALNKELFRRTINLVALRISTASCHAAMQQLQGFMLDTPRLRSIVDDPACPDKSAKTRFLLLNPAITDSRLDALPQTVQDFALSVKAETTTYSLNLDYDYWSAEQILRSILPDELDIPGSFELVGHIAHLNLRPEYLQFKEIIGNVILDKNKYVKTVVNKLDSIDNTFRFFKMEVLAGEKNFLTELKENNCRFEFDFSTVYWNSRLQLEHNRIIQTLKASDRVCDVFAGVGPFAIPAAKNQKCQVYANDLNPASFKYLDINIKKNKVQSLVKPFNQDGREFIRMSLRELNNLDSKSNPTSLAETTNFKWFSHYIMNLPATAIEFLDAFRGLFHDRQKEIDESKLPLIHCYCFSKAADLEADVRERVQEAIGFTFQPGQLKVHRVRDVAPKKEMLCVSFYLPKEVAFELPARQSKRQAESGSDVEEGKRARV
ncbi:guanine(37)-N1-methyltransferase [Zopfochytrium polystomum]|nr:guanine(37)-N1-methyltransferase [Zopfochytrium polystomum]